MANPLFGSVPTVIIRSTTGYIHSKPGFVVGINIANGSTGGNWKFQDGSTAGTVKAIAGAAAATPSLAGTTPYVCLEGITFGTKIHATKTGANHSILHVRFLRRASD